VKPALDPLIAPDPVIASGRDVVWDGRDESFAAKYRSATADELKAAYVKIDAEYERERRSIVDERFKQGLYEEAAVGDEKSQLGVTSQSNGPVSFGWAQDTHGTSLVNKWTVIPAEEYPQFRALGMEWAWLDRQVRPHSTR
jgi:hypothetical protein